MIGKEVLFVLSDFSQIIAKKIEEAISNLREWVNGRIAIIVARLYSHKIRGDILPSTLQEQNPDWESKSGLVLEQQIHCQNNSTRTLTQMLPSPTKTRPTPSSENHVHAIINNRQETAYKDPPTHVTGTVRAKK